MGKVRVRLAPSPTGNLHIGTARTALFNWLFAKHEGGEFMLRIEDTDLERSEKKYEEDIVSGLKWLGIDWDGEIFRQSERIDLYEKYINKLLKSGKAFWCYHSQEELESEKKKQMENKEAPRHICEYKYSKPNESPNGEKGIIRLAVDENSTRVIHFEDKVRGMVEWDEHLLGDISLAKDTKTPLYNFAVVIDDVDMKITHVIRGEDHISNTPKQILIYEALGEKPPIFAHLPLILGSDRSKLSKRHGATSVIEYKKDYLPEALVNFMGFLGYTYEKEILDKKEMAKEFDLSKVHKSGAIFDTVKLDWINSQYVKKLSIKAPEKFWELVGDRNAYSATGAAGTIIVGERLDKLSDALNFDYFWKEPEYDKELLKWKKAELKSSKDSLEEVRSIINAHDFKDKDALRIELDDLGKKLNDRGLVYWPFRVALSGKEKSPDPVDIAYIIGKEKALSRIDIALKKLSS